MSRLEKARAKKQQGKKKIFAVSVFIVLVILAAIFFNLLRDSSPDLFIREEPDFIDTDRTGAFVDFLQLTYVRVYLKDDVTATEVTANGEKLSFNDEHDRWDTVLSGFEPGDELVISILGEDQELTQEVTVVIEKLE